MELLGPDMFIRVQKQDPIDESTSRISLLLRSGQGTRIIALGDQLVTAIVILASVLLAWFLFASLYLVLRDDYVVSSLLSERRAAYAYEDRVMDLRQRIDHMSARQLLDQDSMEVRVASLVARQAELEARHMVVTDLASRAERSNINPCLSISTPGAPAHSSHPEAGRAPRKPRPLPAETGASKFPPLSLRASVESLVNAIEARSALLEREQSDRLAAIGDAAEDEMNRSRQMVAAIGLDPGRFGKNTFAMALPPAQESAPSERLALRHVRGGDSAMGGPLLPAIPGLAAAERFDARTRRAEKAVEAVGRSQAVLEALPVGRPLPELYEQTSGYGTRADPFVGSLAMHSGIDFRAPAGTPIRAIAAGRVISAGLQGGYGRMVEIDHGFGIATRYAHMSAIDVFEGEKIRKGAVIGAVGSTGRSTGPHLHYEVRVDYETTDPTRFVRAGRLAGLYQ